MTWGSHHFKKPPYEFLWYELLWIDSYTLLWTSLSNHQRHGVFLRRAVTPWWKIERGRTFFFRSTQCPAGTYMPKFPWSQRESLWLKINESMGYICIYIYMFGLLNKHQLVQISLEYPWISHSFFVLSFTLNVCLLNPCRKTLHFFQLTPSIAQSVG